MKQWPGGARLVRKAQRFASRGVTVVEKLVSVVPVRCAGAFCEVRSGSRFLGLRGSLALGLVGTVLILGVVGEWSFVAFFRGWVILSLVVGSWAVPVAAFFGLLYAVIRSVTRVESSAR